MATIMILDNDPAARSSLAALLRKQGYTVIDSGEPDRLATKLAEEECDLILADWRFSRTAFEHVPDAWREVNPDIEILVMTAPDDIPEVYGAVPRDIGGCLAKPYHPDELFFTVRQALERRDLKKKVRHLRQEIANHFGYDNIIGESKVMTDLKQFLARVASTNIPVLLTGEPGTGKELCAKVIHHHSQRRHRPFVAVNCAALPENVLERELFGCTGQNSGAFGNTTPGLCAEADGGTLFLDEIGELPLALQSRLLEILHKQGIFPPRSDQAKKIDVRLIASTHADLVFRVRDGLFRQDLHKLLTVMPVHLPPLRERPEDIPLIADYLLRKAAAETEQNSFVLTADSLQALLAHDWPGNVREFENTIRRAMTLANDHRIRAEHIVFVSSTKKRLTMRHQPETTGRSLQATQRVQILRALEENDWNCTVTARELGIGRTTLWRKMKKFGLAQPTGHGAGSFNHRTKAVEEKV